MSDSHRGVRSLYGTLAMRGRRSARCWTDYAIRLQQGEFMPRWTFLVLLASLACASAPPETVPLVGSASDVSSLVGEWSGDYDGGASGRSGSIVFVLRSAADTARGDVMMIPRALGETATGDARRAPLALRSSQVLRIAFVRIAGGAVAGTLDPYTDPDCQCTVQTTFTGTLRGNTIEGTFVTRGSQLPSEQTGRWKVLRR